MYLNAMNGLLFLILMVVMCGTVGAQPRTDPFLQNLLTRAPGNELHQVINDPTTYRLQVIYTRIDRNKHNKPTFTNYYFNYDPDLYFNPASVVKLPLAFLSLEKLNSLRKKKINRYTTIQFDSS